jgi:hypothetical protein
MEGKKVDQGAVKSPEPGRNAPHQPSGQGDPEPAVVRGKGYRAAVLLLVIGVCAAVDNFMDHPHALSPYGWAALAACALLGLYVRKR